MSKNGVELSRRKILAGLSGVGLASAGAGVGTVALFNDEESFEDSTLTAGELDLKVGWQQTYSGPIPGSGGEVGTHPVNAFPDENNDGTWDIEGVLYGVEFDEELYEVDLDSDTAAPIDATVGASGSSSPNGLAYDPGNARLYYSVDDGSSASELYFYDFDTDSNTNAFSGSYVGVNGNDKLAGSNPNVSGSWYDGRYWYIPNKTDDLRYVEFDANGTASGDMKWDDLTGGSRIYRFGDIAVNARGILYGSTNGTQGSTAELFKVDVSSSGGVGTYTELYTGNGSAWTGDRGGDPTGLQLAFDEAGSLYGHDAGSGEFFEIDVQNKSLTAMGSADSFRFTDTANRIDAYDPCDSPEPSTPEAFQSANYPEQQHLVQLGDVKPGDEGEITFQLHLCDNPGYVWLTASNFTQSGGANPDPEPQSASDDDGELAENIILRMWYDEDCNNEYDSGEQLIFGPGINGFTDYGGGNPATLAKAMEIIIDHNDGMVPLDGQSEFMGYHVGAADSERDPLPAETRLCVGVEWWLPIEVGNVIQGDTLSLDLGFYAEQSRNTDGALGP